MGVSISILQKRKAELRGLEAIVQGHRAGEEGTGDSGDVTPASEEVFKLYHKVTFA